MVNYEETLNATRDLVSKHLNLFSKNAFDISILPGRLPIVSKLLDGLKSVLNGTNSRIQIVQIKEKFGGLRFYFDNEMLTPDQHTAIGILVNSAEAESIQTCVVCAKSGKRVSPTGWITTRCPDHETTTNIYTTDSYSLAVCAKHEDELSRILKQD